MDDTLAPLLADQSGLFAVHQAYALGVSRGMLRGALARRWRLVLPGVVQTSASPLTATQRLVAACLYAGEDSMIASSSAAAWHGVTAAAEPRVHVEVPAGRHPRGAGFVVVRRTTRPDERAWWRGPMTITSRERSVVDAARDSRTADRATAIVCEAVHRGIVTLAGVRHELESGRRAGSAVVRQALAAAEAGAWSVPEADLQRLLLNGTELPEPWLNPVLTTRDGWRLPTPDLWWDDVALALQVHSWRWHASMDQWNDTVTADGALVEQGVVVVAVTPSMIDRSSADVLRRAVAGYRQAGSRPRPPVRAQPRGLLLVVN